MGLGKTLSTLALIAATRKSARKWAKQPVEEPKDVEEESKLKDAKVSDMKTKVFGMPDMDDDVKGKKRRRDDTPKNPRRARIARKTRATLLVCPMSTIGNWEEQLRDHWSGKVETVGGSSSVPAKAGDKKIDLKPKVKSSRARSASTDSDDDIDDMLNDTLRVYIYHGPSRRSDTDFVGDFDVVITSYNTLALEYGKQGGSPDCEATPGETAGNSGDEGYDMGAVKPDVEAEIKASEVADALLRKKGKGKTVSGYTSVLQAIDWFRVVLDEAQ
jgi:SWI/SNF-related matrix-associated actin-dependent regulator of chromatin subfamily A3